MKQSLKNSIVFFAAVLVTLFIKICVFDIRFVSGPSMSPALPHGSLILECKLAWGIPVPFRNEYLVRWGTPRVGDLVVYPWNDRYVVKRCAAESGTELAFSHESGYSMRMGGITVPLTAEQYQKLKNADRVPGGMIVALGDNMAESRDSREYGFVSIDSVRGKAIGIAVWK